MDGEFIALLALGTLILVTAWGWRRIHIVPVGTNHHIRAPLEPCWTEEIGHDGRYSYGRACCFDKDLMDVDSRAARGVYQMPFPY